jgi:hypothetical protein
MGIVKYTNLSRKAVQLFSVAILFMGAIGSVKAQSKTDVIFGLKAGVNYVTLSDGLFDSSDEEGKIGFNAGVFARVGKRFYFQPELNYVTFSNSYRFNFNSYKVKFKDLNVPLMVGYKIIDRGRLIFRVSAGPDAYYNLSDQDSPTGSSYKKLSVGGVINAGLDFGNFTVDLRNSIMQTKLNRDFGQKPNIVSLSLGFKFQ